VTRSKGDHSKYPGALVGPEGEICFRRNDPPEDTASSGADEASPPASQPPHPDDRKDSQQ
jgi:hypothetical protein